MKHIIPLLILMAGALHAADFRAGLATTKITPPLPFWLSGYAARTNPATSVRTDLHAKALALSDDQGGRVVIVTTDLIGLPAEVSDEVARRAIKTHSLHRGQILFNSSHTHSGPVVWPNLRVMFDFDAAERERAIQYRRRLTDDLTAVIATAFSNLAPARLAFGAGSAGFAINRRQPVTEGFRIGTNAAGPMDHSVPVLRVTTPEGALRAVLFGYACHNTTVGGNLYRVDGDYAGAAQRNLEKAHPGATALFLILCGADQNPHPRGTYELLEEHGAELAGAVERVLAGELKPVRPPLRAVYQAISLDFVPRTRESFQAEAQDKNKFKVRRAELMLEALDRGETLRSLTYPVQALRFSDDLTLLALGGEVVVDYALRARREVPRENLVVAGWCNQVDCYIPSVRILREGGYEPVDSMIYYAQPGPLAESVEENIFKTLRGLLNGLGAK
jgi:neutral ceramidase